MAIHVVQKEPLDTHTTLQIGGVAEAFVSVTNEAQLQEAVAYAKEQNIPITILGGGSNVLVSDEGVAGLVIHIDIQKKDVIQEGDTILLSCGAGEELDDVVAHAVANEWWGMENLSHIPGTVGATPVQNVGAYGVEVQNIISSVRVFNIDTEAFEILNADACAFAYRDSLFKKPEGKKYIVTEVTYRLQTNPQPQIGYRDLHAAFGETTPSIEDIREAVITIRSKKFPNWKQVGTAGSFFKNPIVLAAKYTELSAIYPDMPGFILEDGSVKVPLGWILDTVLSLKGVQKGSVGTYENQALVLINHGGATEKEVTDFANDIVRQVQDATGLTVEWEVTKI